MEIKIENKTIKSFREISRQIKKEARRKEKGKKRRTRQIRKKVRSIEKGGAIYNPPFSS